MQFEKKKDHKWEAVYSRRNLCNKENNHMSQERNEEHKSDAIRNNLKISQTHRPSFERNTLTKIKTYFQ